MDENNILLDFVGGFFDKEHSYAEAYWSVYRGRVKTTTSLKCLMGKLSLYI